MVNFDWFSRYVLQKSFYASDYFFIRKKFCTFRIVFTFLFFISLVTVKETKEVVDRMTKSVQLFRQCGGWFLWTVRYL